MTSFYGGDKLKARLAELAKKLDKKATLGAGFPVSAGFEEGTSLPVATVAAIHEFGAPGANIPPRPFMRPTVTQHSEGWGEFLAQRLPENDYDVEATLELLGEVMVGQIQEQIVSIESPALSPITLMLRKMFGNDRSGITGSDVGEAARRVAEGEEGATGSQAKPLIWTGFMFRAVKHEITTS